MLEEDIDDKWCLGCSRSQHEEDGILDSETCKCGFEDGSKGGLKSPRKGHRLEESDLRSLAQEFVRNSFSSEARLC